MVAVSVEFCRVGLTYEKSRVSATLCDVGSDVGKRGETGDAELNW